MGNRAIGWVTGSITTIAVLGILSFDARFSVAVAQTISCRGSMNNGWRYTADYRNGKFTRIRWQRSGQQSEVSTLTYTSTNTQGEPVYTGAFRANTLVTLVDLSRGYVQRGSQISINVEEWGWSTGSCGSGAVPAAW